MCLAAVYLREEVVAYLIDEMGFDINFRNESPHPNFPHYNGAVITFIFKVEKWADNDNKKKGVLHLIADDVLGYYVEKADQFGMINFLYSVYNADEHILTDDNVRFWFFDRDYCIDLFFFF